MAKEFRKLLVRNFNRMVFKIFFWGKKTDEDLFKMERDAEHEEGRLPSIVNSTDPHTPVTPQNLLASSLSAGYISCSLQGAGVLKGFPPAVHTFKHAYDSKFAHVYVLVLARGGH